MKHRASRILRRALSAALAVCLLFTLLPAPAWGFVSLDELGDIGEPQAIYTYVLSDGLTATTYMATESTGITLSLVIHKTNQDDAGSYPMPNYDAASEVPWAGNAGMISAVYIQEGVTSVGDYAFSGMSNLVTVDLPSTVTRVGDHAFRGDNKLTSTLDLSQVAEIGESAFYGCSQLPLGELDLSNLSSLGEQAFRGCSKLTGVTLPIGSAFNAIPSYAFAGTGLTSVNIPSNIKTVGDDAFNGCSKLSNIVLQGAETIGASAFYNVPVQTLSLPDTLLSIGASAFERSLSAADTPLTSLTIPESVTSIGDKAFFNHKNLATVTIQGTALAKDDAIGDAAFGDSIANAHSEYIDDPDNEGAQILIGTIFLAEEKVLAALEAGGGDICYLGETSPLTLDGDRSYPATCAHEGQNVYTYSYNGVQKELVETLAKLPDHDWVRIEDKYRPATCTQYGAFYEECANSVCALHPDELHSRYVQNSGDEPLGHKYQLTAATTDLTGGGTITFTCANEENGRHDGEGMAAEVTFTIPSAGSLSGTPLQTLGELELPEVTGGTLSWAEPDAYLSADQSAYAVVFTPDPLTYADYKGIDKVTEFNDAPLTVAVTVDKISLSFDDVRLSGTLVYRSDDLPDQAVTVSGGPDRSTLTEDPKVEYFDGSGWSGTVPSRDTLLNDGQVRVTYTFDPDAYAAPDAAQLPDGYSYSADNDTGEVTITHPYTIVAQDIQNAAISPIPSLTYSGKDMDTVSFSGVPFGSTVNWTATKGGQQVASGSFDSSETESSFDDIQLTEAGTYEISVTITNENTGVEGDTVTLTTEVTIARQSVPLPTVSADLTYDGTEQTGVSKPQDETRYALTGTTAATDAGDYTATAELASGNFVWADGETALERQFSWSIARRALVAPTMAVSGDAVLTYDGGLQQGVRAPSISIDDFQVTISYEAGDNGTQTMVGTIDGTDITAFRVTNAQALNAATYQAIATVENADNFYWYGKAEGEQAAYTVGSYTISPKAVPAPTVIVTSAVYTGEDFDESNIQIDYGAANAQILEEKNELSGETADPQYTYYTNSTGTETVSRVVDAGTYWLAVSYTLNGNYTFQSNPRVMVTIGQAALTLKAPDASQLSKPYTGQLIGIPAPAVSGEIAGESAAAGDWTLVYTVTRDGEPVEPDDIVAAGTYDISVTVRAGGNYKGDPSPLEYALTVTGASGQDITLTPSEGTTLGENDDITKTLGDVGFTVTGAGTLDPTADIRYAVTDNDPNDGAEGTQVISVDESSGQVTILAAGTATVTVTAEKTDNVAKSATTYTVTVERADPVLDVSAYSAEGGNTFPYNGGSPITGYDKATVSGVSDKSLPQPDQTKLVYTFYDTQEAAQAGDGGSTTAPGQVNEGGCWLVVSYPGDANYDAAKSEPIQIFVVEGKLTVSVTGYTDEYDGDEHPAAAITVSYGGAALTPGSDYSIAFSKTEGGPYDIEAMPTVTGVADSGTWYYQITADGYQTDTGSFTAAVTAVPLTLSADLTAEKVYDGKNTAAVTMDTAPLTGVNGETIGVSVSAAYDGTGVGDRTITVTYALTANGVDLGNYAFQNEDGETLARNENTVTETADGKITARPVVIVLDDQKKVYDGTDDVALTGTVEITGVTGDPDSGVVDGETLTASLVPDAAGTASRADVGDDLTVTVAESQIQLTGGTAGNYTFTVSAPALAITHRPVTLQIGKDTGVYGVTPDLSGVSLEDITDETDEGPNSGMVQGQDPMDLFGDLLTVDQGKDPKLTVNGGPDGDGKYAITATQNGEIGNYNVTFKPGTYTVTRRPVTIVIRDAGSLYGQEISQLGHDVKSGSGTYDIVSDDDLTITLSTDAQTGSGAGSYAITGQASGADLGNYAVTFEGQTPWTGEAPEAPDGNSWGTYTVSRATLGLTFASDPLFVPYGDSRANGMTLVNASADGKELTETERGALTFTYRPDNEDAVSVDKDGRVTALQGSRTATITVTVTGDDFNTLEKTYQVTTYPAGGGASGLTVTGRDATYTGQPQALVTVYIPEGVGVSLTWSVSRRNANGSYTEMQPQQDVNGLPAATDAGDYRVTWSADFDDSGYDDITGQTVDVTIAKADPFTGFAHDTLTKEYPTVTSYDGTDETEGDPLRDLPDELTDKVEYTSLDTTVATVVSKSHAQVQLHRVGTATIQAYYGGDDNYNSKLATYTLNVVAEGSQIEYQAAPYSVPYDGQPHGSQITVDGSYNATVWYQTSTGGGYSSAVSPTITDVGSLDIRFQLQAEGYTSTTGIQTVTVTAKDLGAADVALTGLAEGAQLPYTGAGIDPAAAVRLTYKGMALTPGADYTASYAAVGGGASLDSSDLPLTAGDYTLTLTGGGNYTGTRTVGFSVTALDASYLTASLDRYYGTYGDPETNTATVTVTYGGEALTLGEDYILSCDGTESSDNTLTFTQVRSHTVAVTGTGSYTGTVTLTYTLLPASDPGGLTLTADGSASPVVAVYGDDINGTISVADPSGSGLPLDPALYDLTYTYQDALGGAVQDKGTYDPDAVFNGAAPAPAGLYVVTATLKAGGGTEGSGTFVFLVQKRSLDGADIALDADGLVYDGEPQTPGVTSVAWGTLGDLDITADDYDITWKNNKNAGQGYAVVSAETGSNNFTGTAAVPFSIAPLELSAANGFTVDPISEQLITAGGEARPGVTVRDKNGTALASGDYTLTYADNGAAGTASVTVHGRGNYTGDTLTAEFTVTLSGVRFQLTVENTAWTWGSGTDAGAIRVLTDNDAELVLGNDYTLTVTGPDGTAVGYATADDARAAIAEPGTYTVTAQGSGTGSYSTGMVSSVTVTVSRARPSLTVAASPASHTGSTSITLTVTAAGLPAGVDLDGEELLTVTRTVSGGSAAALEPLSLTQGSDPNTYTAVFQAPNSDASYRFSIDLTAEPFTAAGGYDAGHYELPDVTPASAVVYASGGGGGGSAGSQAVTHSPYVAGYEDGTFRPDGNITRAEAASIFARLLAGDDPVPGGLPAPFDDVVPGDWYYDIVNYLYRHGITAGRGNGLFAPEDTITRAEFVTMCAQFAAYAPVDTVNAFADVSAGHWAYPYINYAVREGWVTGYADGTFRPDAPITRAEAVVVVNGMLHRAPDTGYLQSHGETEALFRDLSDGHWAFPQIMEAAWQHRAVLTEDGERWQ